MEGFICPCCKGGLLQQDKTLKCKNGHSFDISKKGYVNLLMSQTSKKRNHGDDKEMLTARRAFLEKGFYAPLADGICSIACENCRGNAVVLDAGCGEGYYTQKVYDRLLKEGKNPLILAVDISKNALDMFKSSDKNMKRAVASIFNMPIMDNSCDIILNVFAPYCFEEYLRVLKKNGIMILAIPLERHLYALKNAVYDEPYENKVQPKEIDGFKFVEEKELKYSFKMENNSEIENLFMMTPYYHKTSLEDIKKLESLDFLECEAEFGILVYKKN